MSPCDYYTGFSDFHTFLENSRAWLAHLLALRALSGLLPRVMARFQAPAPDPSGLARVSGPGRAALASRCVWNEGRAAPTRTKCAAFPVPRTLWRVQPRAYACIHFRACACMTTKCQVKRQALDVLSVLCRVLTRVGKLAVLIGGALCGRGR